MRKPKRRINKKAYIYACMPEEDRVINTHSRVMVILGNFYWFSGVEVVTEEDWIKFG